VSEKNILFLLLLLVLIVRLVCFLKLPMPRSLDEFYYLNVAKNLVDGKGLITNINWHYLLGIQALPAPSHSVWMPLTSFVCAASYFIFGKTYAGSRILILIISLFIPFITYKLAGIYNFNIYFKSSAALLSILSGWYLIYFVTADNFALYGTLVPLLFYFLHFRKKRFAVISGILCGLTYLSRSDGVIVFVSVLVCILFSRKFKLKFAYIVIFIVSYFMMVFPWYMRNLQVFGSISPVASKMLCVKQYEDIFTPYKSLNFSRLLSNGILKEINRRISTLFKNSVMFVILNTYLFLVVPFFIGVILCIKRKIFTQYITYLILHITGLSILFPAQSLHGTFWHSSVAFLPLCAICIIAGTEELLKKIKKDFIPAYSFFIFFLIYSGIYSWLYTDFLLKDWNSYNKEIIPVLKKVKHSPVMMRRPGRGAYFAGLDSYILPFISEKKLMRLVKETGVKTLIIKENNFNAIFKFAKKYNWQKVKSYYIINF